MDQNSSIQNIWLIITLWGFIYLADYYLTILFAKKHQEFLYKHVGYEGSLELTPQFQKDVDGLQLISPQFLIRWLFSILLFYVLWWLSVIELGQSRYFYFFVGALVLREIAIHLRHFRNLAVCYIGKTGGIEGKIKYSRWFVLKLSAAELLSFCFVYLILAVFVSSWFLLGGAFGCLVVAIQHWLLSRKAFASSQAAQDEIQNA